MPDKDTFNLHAAFRGEQKSLRTLLETGRDVVEHPVAKGDGTELYWKEMLAKFLPSRYQVDKGFVIDSTGKISKQIDIIVFDRTFSPLLWDHGGHRYIPAESVYAVFEVKQDHSLEYIKSAAEKAESVRKLHRTQGEFGWLKGKGKKELTHILAGLLTVDSEWKPAFGDSFYNALRGLPKDGYLDIGCALTEGSWSLEDHMNPRTAELSTKEAALISFCMHLLQGLQRLGTVGGIDYSEYAREAGLTLEINVTN